MLPLPKKKKRMTRAQCRLAWALALGLAVAPVTKTHTAYAMDYGDATEIDGTTYYVITIDSSYTGLLKGQGIIGADYNDSATASYGIVTVNGVTTSNYYYGGRGSSQYNADYNTVTVTNGSVVNNAGASDYQIIGGYVSGSTYQATYNTVTIEDGSKVTVNGIVGGYSKTSQYNTVSIDNSTVTIDEASYFSNLYGIFGGYSKYSISSVADNKVYIESATVTANVDSAMIAGGASYSGYSSGTTETVSGNTVSITDSTVTDMLIYGGYTYGGTATGNSVEISGDTKISGDNYSAIYGGYSDSGTASANSVTITATTDDDGNTTAPAITGTVYGNYSASGTATTVTSTTTTNDDGEDETTTTYTTAVTVSGGTIEGNIYGNYSESGEAIGTGTTDTPDVLITDGEVTNAYGGYAASDEATENTVTITGGTISGSVYGGMGTYATANAVSISDGTVTGDVYGNYSSSGSATGATTTTTDDDNNETTTADTSTYSVTITGSTISGNIYGGSGKTGANYNTVTVADSSAKKSIFGGYSSAGTADGNVVTVTNTTGITSIEGGAAIASQSASDNTVTVSGSEADNVYGGYSGKYGATDDNKVTADSGTYTYIVGGYTSGGTADGNTVTLTGGEFGYVLGAVSWDYNNSTSNTAGATTNNTVNITPDDDTEITIGAHVSGGFTAYGSESTGNTVTIEDGTTVQAAVSGGILFLGSTVSGNTVTINGGTIHGADVAGYFDQVAVVAGGLGIGNAEGAIVTENTAIINGGTIEGDVYGGYTVDGARDASATYNTVLITDGDITGSVYGGRSEYGDATSNTVTITGGSVNSGTASIADVSISQGLIVDFEQEDKTMTGDVYGGAADHSGDATSNAVYIGTDADGAEYGTTVSIAGSVYGGYAQVTNNDLGVSDAESNSVTSNGAEITGSVYGGYVYSYNSSQSEAETGNANENTVTLTDTTVTGSVYGGYTESESASTTTSGSSTYKTATTGNANENTVTITGGTITENVYGGYTQAATTTENSSDATAGTADSNAVTITDAEISGSVWGGYSSATVYNDDATATGGGATGNTVTIGTADTTEDDTTASAKRRAASSSAPTDDESGIATASTEEDDDSTTISGSVYGGYGATATANAVTVYGGTISENVYGNYATTGTATSVNDDEEAVTAVTVTGGTVEGDIYGNYSESGEAIGTGDTGTPDVVITGGTVENTVYGGQGTSATDNIVSISGEAQIGVYVVGGDATGTSSDEETAEASGNVVLISDSAVIGTNTTAYTNDNDESEAAEADVIAGWATSGSATENTVTMTGGTVYGNITGGYGAIDVKDNTVEISGGSVTGYAYGGYGAADSEAEVSGNSVVLSGTATVSETAYGGYSTSSSATVTGNSVTMSDTANVTYAVIGGYNSSTDGAEVSNNTVTITEGATVSGFVYGGQSYGSVTGNTVKIEGDGSTANAWYIIGGYSFGNTTEGDATDNSVTVDNALIQYQYDGTAYSDYASIYGGYTLDTASGNEVSITNSTVDGSVTGGYGTTATGNTVTISDSSKVTGTVYGNYASGTATGAITATTTDDDGNETTSTTYTTSVTITDSTVGGTIYGGYSSGGDATYNAVSLTSSTIGGDVYGGYGTTATYNTVSLNGNVAVTGTVYGGNVSDDYTGNSLQVASTDNSATTLANFDSITFDLDGISDDDVMLTLSSSTDLTGVSSIGVTNDDSTTKAATPGATIYLIVSESGITVLESSLTDTATTLAYTLDEDYDTENGTEYIEGGASLDGTYDREIMVVTTSTDDDALTVDSESEADDEGVLSGTALVLRTSDTVDVTDVDFNLAATDDGNAELAWGTTLITLDSDVKYSFDTATDDEGNTVTATVESIDDLTVTGISGTLIADSATSTLLDGSASTVSGLDEVDLDSLNGESGITITYSPSDTDEITVTGTVIVEATGADDDGENDSLQLVSSSIDTITFGDVAYSTTAPITLTSGNTYDMSDTEIDVSGLTLVDSDGEEASITVDGGEIVMTLIDANGATTKLGSNAIAETPETTSQTFGYTLEGNDEAQLDGTINGVVTAEADDDDTDGTYADLVLKADTTVNVETVELGLTASEDGESENATVAWGDTTVLTLNSVLTYDFNGATDDDGNTTAATVSGLDDEIEITGLDADTLLAIDAASTVLDGSSSTVSNLSEVDLSALTAEYTYAPADGVTVTGDASVTTATLNADADADEDSEADSLVLAIDSITAMDFDVTDQTAGSTMLALSESSSTDLDEAVITITDGLDTLSLNPGETLTLISAADGSTLDVTDTTLTAIADEYATLDYSLPDDNTEDNASLTGTYDQSLQYVDETTEDETTTAASIALVADNTVNVTEVDFDLDDTATLTWGDTVRMTLEDADTGIAYAFSSDTATEGISDAYEVTGDATSGTLIADGATSTLLDGRASTVSGLDQVDLDSLNGESGITITYSPSDTDVITVTGTVIVEATDTDSDGEKDTLQLVSSSIDTVTFGTIEYSDTAPITLTSGSTYDMSETEINVSGLTLVDSDGEGISLTVDGGEIVMTLIDANGATTNLGSNDIASDPASTAQTFGYELTGEENAVLDGTVAGTVTVSADDGDTAGTYADLVLKADTTVNVETVDLGDFETSDGSTVIEWGDDARLTLNSALTYDFTDATLAEDSAEALSNALTITGVENDLLASGESLTLIDGSSSTVVSISALGTTSATYTYTPADGVTVDGDATTGANSDGNSYELTITNIGTIDFDVEGREDGSTMLSLTDDVTDLSGVEITLTNDDTITTPGYTLTLIGTTGSLTTTDISLPELDDGKYALEDGTSGASLDGTFDRTVSESADDSGTVTAIVLTTGTEIAVGNVDLNIDASLDWSTGALLTLESGLSYDFSSAETDALSDITIDGIEGTLAANGEYIVLIDGTAADGVTGLGTLTDAVATGYTYTPASGITVTGTTEGSTADDGASLTMAIGSIDTITFGSVTYSETAPITLTSGNTYDMSATEIDVSGLTLVDSAGEDASITVEGGEIVMTLIDANGATTNLGSNTIAGTPETISQTFGYLLEGDGEALIEGTVNGIVTASAETDDTAGTYADLVLRADTAVTVTDVTLDLTELTPDDPQLTLTEGLSYDFSGITDDDITVASNDGTTTITGADTLLDGTILIIDGTKAEAVTGIESLAGQTTTYEYTIDTGTAEVGVTGNGTTVVTSNATSLGYSLLNILTLDFYIDADTPTDEAVLTVESADLSGTDVTLHADGGDYLSPGYTITLLEADELTTSDETTYATIVEGVSVEYEIEIGREGNTIVASIPEDAERTLRNETKSLPETRLAQLALVDQGSDAFVFAFDEALMTSREKTKWTPYAAFSLGSYRYDTGSSLDLDTFHSTIGLLRNYFDENGVFSWGPVFQYGQGDYVSKTNGVRADGESEYVGGGLFARRRWNTGTYLEGAITGGYSEADYGSSTLLDGEHVTFDVGSKYWTAYVGLGRDYEYTHGRNLRLYGKYFYSNLFDADSTLSSGERYSFDDADSSRLRVGARMTWNMNELDPTLNDRYFVYAGAAYQYQFEGSAFGVYDGMRTLSPSLRGGSGIFEGGVHFTPKQSNLTINLNFAGYVGAQQGIEGRLRFKWDL